MQIEEHPFPLFLPSNAKLLMLGSSPPKKEKWSMDFYYPNIQNDMWRIFGLIFFNNKNYFLNQTSTAFDKEKIIFFLTNKGIALGDVGQKIIRLKDNASDKFLSIIEPIKIDQVLLQLKQCTTIVSTGEKSLEKLFNILNINKKLIKPGNHIIHYIYNKNLNIYRMPSSSRAYPLNLEKKSIIYKQMFKELNML